MSEYYEASTSLEDAMNKIEGLNGYFADCAAMGQGINTKEVRWMREAMIYAIKTYENPFTALSKIMPYATNDTSMSVLRRAIDEVNPNLAKLFA